MCAPARRKAAKACRLGASWRDVSACRFAPHCFTRHDLLVDPHCGFPSGGRRATKTKSKFASLRWHGAALLGLLVAFAVHRAEPEAESRKILPKTLTAARFHKAATAEKEAEVDASARCLAERQRLLGQPGLPGAPGFEAARTQILGHAKAEPVLLVQTPKLEPSDDPAIRRYQRVTTG